MNDKNKLLLSLLVFQEFVAKNNLSLMTSHDLDGAGAALLRLQRVYNITTQDMITGNVSGKKTFLLLGFFIS